MFYAQFVLAKKGPLSKIWLAAHWERKLSKAQIFETDVQSAVDEIITPKTKLSLRTTGHLLLGIVRIYSKKAKYVLADCNEAFIKIKMAFRPGTAGEMQLVDKRDRGNSETGLLEDLDTMMPDLSAFDYAPGPAQIQQSRIDDITLQEDNFDTRSLRDHNFLTDDMNDFGECDSNFDEEFERTRRNFEMFQQSTSHGSGIEVERRSVTYMEDGESLIGGHTRAGSDRFDEEDFGMGAGADDEFEQQYAQLMNGERMEVDEPHAAADALGSTTGVSASPLPSERAVGRPKRRRKLIVDENTTISGEEMKHNLADYSDTVQPLDLAPPTKRLMKLKEAGLAERIFNLPATDLFVNDHFLHFYQSHLIPEAKKDPNAPTAEDIRRTLNLTDGTDEDYENDDPNQLPEMSLEQLLQEDDFGELPLEEPEEPAAAEENGRTLNVLNSIVHRLRINDNQIVLDDLLTKGSTNKSVAQKFYALLELHKSQAIRIDQNEAYGPIVIEPGVQMDEFAGQS
ncbi:Rad21 / Rec8 like protein [Aphelenchoides fujianensis]|nr:Rad21 / Rec8 like protein [Aphelenchoides fujianensis]